MRLTEEQYNAIMRNREEKIREVERTLEPAIKSKVPAHSRKNKYRNVPTYVDGIRFSSKAEAKRYENNKARIAAGELAFQLLQVPFYLPAPKSQKPKRYLLDFLEVFPDGSIEYIDVKGMQTPEFKIKKDVIEATYKITIQTPKE